MTKDELWEKWFDGESYGEPVMSHAGFLAALAEYGASVRARDAEIAANMFPSSHCAAAIAREPLP